MPGAGVVVDALLTIGDEGLQPVQIGSGPGRGDDDDERTVIERDKGLAAVRMILHVIDPARQIELAAVHEADHGAGIVTTELDPGQRMVTVGHAVINRITIVTVEFDYIAKRGKSLALQRFYLQSIRHEFFPAAERD